MADINRIYASKKKLCCCLEEQVESAMKGVAIRVEVRTALELADAIKPIDSVKFEKTVELLEKAHRCLLEAQKLLD